MLLPFSMVASALSYSIVLAIATQSICCGLYNVGSTNNEQGRLGVPEKGGNRSTET